MDNPVSTEFPSRVMSFSNNGEGDEVSNETLLADVTDAGEGFAEVAITYGEERIYIAFRVSDLMRAIKEASA